MNLTALLSLLVKGPNSKWSDAVALAFIGLMIVCMALVSPGFFFGAALLSVFAAAIFMAVRGVLARPLPTWYLKVLQALAATSFIVAALSSATAVVGAISAKLG